MQRHIKPLKLRISLGLVAGLFLSGCFSDMRASSSASGSALGSNSLNGPLNGACGSANGTMSSNAPTSGLCNAGMASALAGSGPWTWSCMGTGGGSNASCNAGYIGTNMHFLVTPGGSNVTFTPNSAQDIASGKTASFTLTASTDNTLSASVGGTCPIGSFSGSVYTTGQIVAGCTVTFSAISQQQLPVSYQDGVSAAPSGSPQFPNMLGGYTKRPAWHVAGADYYVGVPSGIVLKDPTVQANLPSGATYNADTNSVTVSGTVTLSGFDFSLHNATLLNVTGGNVTVDNCRFAVGSNSGALGRLVQVTGTGNVTFYNNEFNGNDAAVTAQVGQTINISNSGTDTFEYNYFHDSGGDMIDFNSGTRSEVIQYNLFYNIGVNTAHADTLQWYGANEVGSTIGFNTIYQVANQPGAGMGGLAIYDEGPGGNMSDISVNNNTVIQLASCTTCNWTLDSELDLGATGDHVSFRDNYIDPTGALGYTGMWLFATDSLQATFANPTTISGTINMVTGSEYETFPQANSYTVVPDASGYTPSMNDVYSVSSSPSSGTLSAVQTLTISLNMNAQYSVTGMPTLSLSNGGVATYTSGSGTGVLTFSYISGSSSIALSSLSLTGVNLNGGSITDVVGNAANFVNLNSAL